MSDTSHVIGASGIAKKLVDLGDGTYADAVVDFNSGSIAETANVLAAPTGSDGGLGKLPATIANTEFFYVRCDTSARPYTYVDWVVSHAQQADMAFYKSQTIVDEVTLTLASFTDTNTIIINGLTYTGESTANTADARLREFSTAGATDTNDALALANLINADYVVVTAGTSVAATDKLTFTTDEGERTIVAKATSANYPGGQYLLNATAATEAASIVLAINHKDNVTCAADVAVGMTVTVNGLVFTAAAAEAKATRAFDQDAGANATATSLAACINDATYGVPGVTAAAVGAVVSLTRDSMADTVTVTSSSATKLVVEAGGGVPGVIAAVSGLAAGTEIVITPTWTNVLTVVAAGAQLTVTDIDCPGILATAADAVVTLTPGTPAGTDGELATVIYATAAANCTVDESATLAGLMIDSGTTAISNEALTTGTAGTIEPAQAVGGMNYCYLKFTADNATPQAVSISAIKRI